MKDEVVAELVAQLQAAFARYGDAPRDSAEYIHLLVGRLDGKVRIVVQKERNHTRPHFHAKAPDGCDVSVDIATGEILAGDCRRHWRILRRWAFAERERLMTLWESLNEREPSAFELGE